MTKKNSPLGPPPPGWRLNDNEDNETTSRDELVTKLFEDWSKKETAEYGEVQGWRAFEVGFTEGERVGYTRGFGDGAKQAVAGLIGDGQDGERARTLAQGNMLQKPSTKYENVKADQLTAELVNVLSMYAILPTEVRIAATMDALRSLPTVEVKPRG
jgi:hypothetical protein